MNKSLIVLLGLAIGLIGVACDASPLMTDPKTGEVVVSEAGEIMSKNLSGGISYWNDLTTGACFAVYYKDGTHKGEINQMTYVPCDAVEGKTLLFRSR